MKLIIFLIFSTISCATNTSKPPVSSNMEKLTNQQSTFKKIINNNNSYSLFYKVETNVNSPVQLFSYYITDSKTNKVVKKTEQVAAEKIYWKDNNTLAIIPYTEMIQKNDVVGAPVKTNEILIKIK